MYNPATFRECRPEFLYALIDAHPLGLLISHSAAAGLLASPLPFISCPQVGERGVLRAHFARANPHWRELDGETECLIVFQGEQAYVTPSWYPTKALTHQAVPTWNYCTVQVRGAVRVHEDPVWLRALLSELTARHEHFRPHPWSLADAPEAYIAAQLKAVVGIEITIKQIEGKWKMSQNRERADREGVIAGLSNAADPHADPRVAAIVAARLSESGG